jgi:hypothetical protein
MYIWNINALVSALREGSLTEKQTKNYRVAFWVIVALSIMSFAYMLDISTMNKYDVIDTIQFVLINGIGLYLLFYIYKKRNRKDLDFIIPFISLSIPLFIRSILWTILVSIIGYTYILFFAPYHSMDETNLIDVLISTIVDIMINVMFVHYFKKIFN